MMLERAGEEFLLLKKGLAELVALCLIQNTSLIAQYQQVKHPKNGRGHGKAIAF